MNTLRYRYATVEDASLLARLNLQLIEDGADFGPADLDYLEPRMRRWLAAEDNRGVVFEDERGRLLAYAVYEEGAREIYLRQFLVLPAARRNGVGRTAFHLLRERLWDARKRLTLEVLSGNRAAYRFWRALGYRDCAVTLEIPVREAPATVPVKTASPALSPSRLLVTAAAWITDGLRTGWHRSGLPFLLAFLSSPIAAATLSQPDRLPAAFEPIALQRIDPTDSSFPRRVFTVQQLLQPLAVEPGPGVEMRQPSRAGAPHPLSAAELRAIRAMGGRCPSSVYRTAWAVAHEYAIEPHVVVAVIEAESSCRADAVSRAGARGLMQLVPGSGARHAYRLVYGHDGLPSEALLRDPEANIRLGVAYLRALHDHFARVASAEVRQVLAIAAYNCGTDLFDQELPLDSSGWSLADMKRWIARNAPRETRNYVALVLDQAGRYGSALASARMAADS